MSVRPTKEEIDAYLGRIASLEKHVVLPARIAVILSCILLLWPIIAADIGAQQLGRLLRLATVAYAFLSLVYWLYVFRIAQKAKSMTVTKAVVFAAAVTDTAFLGVLLYALTLQAPGEATLASGPEASLFGVYCALLLRNVFLFPGPALQTLVNLLCILGYVSAFLFSMWLPRASAEFPRPDAPALVDAPATTATGDVPRSEQRDLLSRTVILCLVSVCGSTIYALRQRQIRQRDEDQERTIRSLRLDIAGMLAGQVAHELKNPLSIMNNAAFLLRRATDSGNSRVTEQLNIIEDEIGRAASIITELLDYAKLAEGKIQRVPVNRALDEAVSALKHEFASRQVHVTKGYSLDLPFLFIDPAQLRQVFINLLLNACEAIEKDGSISIKTAYSRDGFIEVWIADNGKGMPSEVAANVFRPFYTTKEAGTGMGLAIVQNLVRAYRGEVALESTPGVGTTFQLRFPTRMAMFQSEQAVASSPQSVSSPWKRQKRSIAEGQKGGPIGYGRG